MQTRPKITVHIIITHSAYKNSLENTKISVTLSLVAKILGYTNEAKRSPGGRMNVLMFNISLYCICAVIANMFFLRISITEKQTITSSNIIE